MTKKGPRTGGRVLSGIQPTGELHIGNYLGAVQNWVRLQDEFECFYPIVDYHAITTPFDASSLPKLTEDMVISLIADLDRPGGGFIRVTHQPLIEVQTSMSK